LTCYKRRLATCTPKAVCSFDESVVTVTLFYLWNAAFQLALSALSRPAWPVVISTSLGVRMHFFSFFPIYIIIIIIIIVVVVLTQVVVTGAVTQQTNVLVLENLDFIGIVPSILHFTNVCTAQHELTESRLSNSAANGLRQSAVEQ
jgi:hypothetical protein